MDDPLPVPVADQMPVEPSGSLPADAAAEVAALARRLRQANGPVMRVMNAAGGQIEMRLRGLPAPVRRALDRGTSGLLERCYHSAGVLGALPQPRGIRGWGHRIAAAGSGAAGGFAGLGSAVIELPATVTLFFSAMQRVAGDHGFDPRSEDVRLTCIDIFGSGGPLTSDDGLNTAFVSARLALSGTAVHALIARVAPSFAAVLGRKLASQTVPVLGAAAGAAVNLAYLEYYREMAEVRFGLARLAQAHGEAAVQECLDHALGQNRPLAAKDHRS